ncbi:hypothetical protein Hanom_Chr17g01568031 [Helianthus anomalus]
MGYGEAWIGVWVRALVDTWNGSIPTTQTHVATPTGYGRAWVGDLFRGHEFGLAFESLPCHLLARPTPGFKPTPMGATPKSHAQSKPPGMVAWAFLANPHPNPSPIPLRLHPKIIEFLFLYLNTTKYLNVKYKFMNDRIRLVKTMHEPLTKHIILEF